MKDDNVLRPLTPTPVAYPPLDPTLPTVFVVGDSTASNGPDLGWGDHFAHYFDTTKINVANRARGGRSSRSYIEEGLWDAVQAQIEPGDFVLIQMGHNDGGELNTGRARGSLQGIGEEQQDVVMPNGKTVTVHTYGWYIRKYIADTRAKGATPILLTLTIRNIWTDGHIERDMGYDAWMKQIAAAQNVALADVGKIAADKWEAMGQSTTATYYPIDHTHSSVAGAEMNAASVVEALRVAKSPLVQYLKPAP
jgi:lysophospholipase L1-like esterase